MCGSKNVEEKIRERLAKEIKTYREVLFELLEAEGDLDHDRLASSRRRVEEVARAAKLVQAMADPERLVTFAWEGGGGGFSGGGATGGW